MKNSLTKRLISFALALLFVLPLMQPLSAYAEEDIDLENFAGLCLTAPSDAKVVLYEGLAVRGTTGTEVSPSATETVDGTTYYYYPNLQGEYYYSASRSGYYTVYKDIYMSAQEAATNTQCAVVLNEKGGNGWEPSSYYSHTDEVLETSLASDPSLWPAYTSALDIPSLQDGHPAHQMTTQTEMEAFIDQLNKDGDNMYVYTLGQSTVQKMDIPLVMFTETKLSEDVTWEDAAALVNANGKPTVLYRAQMHGNEPGAGEGALATLKYLQEGYAEEILSKINLVVVPRTTPDSAYNYSREMPSGINPNRDALRLESEEMQLIQQATLLFDPIMVLDGHERVWNNQGGEMAVQADFTPNNSEAFKNICLAVDKAAVDNLTENGLNGFYYSNNLNEYNPNMGGTYLAAKGTIYVIMESRGIWEGNDEMARRALSHVLSVEGILNYVVENADRLQQVKADEQAAVTQSGKTYEDTDIVPLHVERTRTTASTVYENQITQRPYYDWATGAITYPNYYVYVYDSVTESRPAPTAYVIPDGQSWTEDVLALLDQHGISYTRLEAGATISLQQYTGTVEAAALTEESKVTFAKGAVVVCLNQYTGKIASFLFEPDITDAAQYKGTLAQQGLIPLSGESFPIYRYVRDLNQKGFVNYTIEEVEPEPTLPVYTTVYLDPVNGSDDNTGFTADAPVASVDQAYSQLAVGLTDAREGTVGTVVLMSDLTLAADAAYTFPSHDFPVILTGKTGSEAIIKAYNTTQKNRAVGFAGETTLQNIAVTFEGTSDFNYLLGNGNKLTVGKNVTVTGKVSVAGGSYGSSSVVASADTTVLSGKWENVYAGGYQGAVTGTAKLTINGATVGSYVLSAYTGACGSVEMTLSNTTVTTGIFGGPAKIGSNNNGNVNGNVTMVLGENVSSPLIYGGSRDSGNVVGTVTVILDGADLTSATTFSGSCKNSEYAVGSGVLVLKNGKPGAYADFDTVNLDTSAGGNVVLSNAATVKNVTGGGSVTLLNTATLTVTGTATDTTKLVVADAQMDTDYILTTSSLKATAFSYDGDAYFKVREVSEGYGWYLTDLIETDAVLIYDPADGSGMVCDEFASALEVYEYTAENPRNIRLYSDLGAESVSQTVCIDLNGNTVSQNFANTETTYFLDSMTDDFTVKDSDGNLTGYGKLPVSLAETAQAADGYLMITEDDGISFHRVDSDIRYLYVDTEDAAMNYEAIFGGDELVATQVKQYGIVASITGVPELVNGQLDEKTCLWSENTGFTAGNTQEVLGAKIINVLNPNEATTTNKLRANLPIYSRSYIMLNDGTVFLSDEIQQRSFRWAVEQLDGDTTAAASEQVQDLYESFSAVMNSWNIPNIIAAAKEN